MGWEIWWSGTRGREEFTGSRNPAVSTADFASMDFATAENAGRFVERTFCWMTMGWEEGVMDEVVGLFTI